MAEEHTLTLNLKQAAKHLNLSVSYLRLLVRRRAIPHVRIGKRILFPLSQLQSWLEVNAVKSSTDK
jgi:excisionase family DNA binding protein